jgi:hypothetical protein
VAGRLRYPRGRRQRCATPGALMCSRWRGLRPPRRRCNAPFMLAAVPA